MLVNRPAPALDAAPSRSASTGRPAALRSRTTNNPVRSRARRSTPQGRRIADLYDAYFAALGSPIDAGTQASILGAAELVVAAEAARSQLLAGSGEIDAVIRLEGTAARSLRRLGIKPNGSSTPHVPLRDRLLDVAEEG